MSGRLYEAHVDWVTSRVRRWFAEEHPGWARREVGEIRRENRAAGNDPEESDA